jgi:hypothetical protein
MTFKSYEYNALCDVCGFKKKATDLRRRWDGFMVCKDDWEQRHPLDFYRTRNDTHLLPFIRSDNDGVSVAPTVLACTLVTRQGRADTGVADCARADTYNLP